VVALPESSISRDPRPIPGTTVTAHMVENAGAANVSFTSGEIPELNVAVRAIEIKGQRLPDAIPRSRPWKRRRRNRG
jgi:hypothetical protein